MSGTATEGGEEGGIARESKILIDDFHRDHLDIGHARCWATLPEALLAQRNGNRPVPVNEPKTVIMKSSRSMALPPQA